MPSHPQLLPPFPESAAPFLAQTAINAFGTNLQSVRLSLIAGQGPHDLSHPHPRPPDGLEPAYVLAHDHTAYLHPTRHVQAAPEIPAVWSSAIRINELNSLGGHALLVLNMRRLNWLEGCGPVVAQPPGRASVSLSYEHLRTVDPYVRSLNALRGARKLEVAITLDRVLQHPGSLRDAAKDLSYSLSAVRKRLDAAAKNLPPELPLPQHQPLLQFVLPTLLAQWQAEHRVPAPRQPDQHL